MYMTIDEVEDPNCWELEYSHDEEASCHYVYFDDAKKASGGLKLELNGEMIFYTANEDFCEKFSEIYVGTSFDDWVN